MKLRGATRTSPADQEWLGFDYDKILFYLSALTSFDNGWAHYFSSNRLAPLILWYEDLSTAYSSSVRAALGFLGLSVAGTRIEESRYERTANAQSLQWVERFKSMQSAARKQS